MGDAPPLDTGVAFDGGVTGSLAATVVLPVPIDVGVAFVGGVTGTLDVTAELGMLPTIGSVVIDFEVPAEATAAVEGSFPTRLVLEDVGNEVVAVGGVDTLAVVNEEPSKVVL